MAAVPSSFASAFSLDGEIVLVTGAGTGLGLGMARCLHAAGARVALVGRREAPLREAEAALGDRAAVFVHDVLDLAAAPALVAAVTERLGPPTILINNAGIHLKKPAVETGDAEFAGVLGTHVNGAFALSRAAAPGMIARGHGSILFISSMTAFMGMPLVVAYSAAKAALTGLVQTLSEEWAPLGVRVNAIAPGWIDSPMLRKSLDSDPERKRRVLSRIQMEGFGDPNDIGWAATYLCSGAARYVTGVILPVDGGGIAGF